MIIFCSDFNNFLKNLPKYLMHLKFEKFRYSIAIPKSQFLDKKGECKKEFRLQNDFKQLIVSVS